jgi:hypothetical protein
MASSTPAQLRAGVAAYLAAHVTYTDTTGVSQPLRTYTDGETIIEPPCALILPQTGKYIDYLVSFGPQGAAYDWSTRIIVLISKADVRTGTIALDGFLATHGPTSIPAALTADPTCGGVADFVVPVEAQWMGNLEYAGQEFMGGTITLDVGAE